MKKKNLIFFLAEFVRGGAGNSILSLCKNLKKKDFNLNILCLGKCEYRREFKGLATIHEIPCKRTLFAQNYIKKIITKISSNQLNTIFISNLFHANVLTALFQKKRKKLRFIFTERTALKELFIYFGILDFIKKMIIKLLIKYTYKKPDLIIANSKKTAKDLRDYTNCKTKFISPGTFSGIKKIIKIKRDIKNIIWIGRLSEEKGIEHLISSLKDINKKEYKLKIIGDGPLKNKINKMILENDLFKNIDMLGFKFDIFDDLKNSDLLINTSYFEGFPNVVIEALSCSVPVLCSRSGGGISEILEGNKHGDLFDLKNAKDLNLKIKNFLNNSTRLKKKAINSHRSLVRFDKIKSAKNYKKVFDSLKF